MKVSYSGWSTYSGYVLWFILCAVHLNPFSKISRSFKQTLRSKKSNFESTKGGIQNNFPYWSLLCTRAVSVWEKGTIESHRPYFFRKSENETINQDDIGLSTSFLERKWPPNTPFPSRLPRNHNTKTIENYRDFDQLYRL